MVMKKFHSKAQSISEYVIVIGLVTAALFGMQAYMKRGIQAVIKDQADQLGPQNVRVLGVTDSWVWSDKCENSTGTVKKDVSPNGSETRNTNSVTNTTGVAVSWKTDWYVPF
jgi:hypothetical protein